MHRRTAWPPCLLSLPEQIRPTECAQYGNDRNRRDVVNEYVLRDVHASELHERAGDSGGSGTGKKAGRTRP